MPESAADVITLDCDSKDSARSACNSNSVQHQPLDAELRQVVKAWSGLPEPVQAGIIAMVNAPTR